MFLLSALAHTIFMSNYEQNSDMKSANDISDENNVSAKNLDIRKLFGENVKFYRKKMGLSQEQLAEKLDVSPNHISVIETGGKFVTYKMLEKMISIFNVMPSALFYTHGTAVADDSLQNTINLIVKTELDSAFEEISRKISKIE